MVAAEDWPEAFPGDTSQLQAGDVIDIYRDDAWQPTAAEAADLRRRFVQVTLTPAEAAMLGSSDRVGDRVHRLRAWHLDPAFVQTLPAGRVSSVPRAAVRAAIRQKG